MNLQSHQPGQVTGQVLNQAGASLSGIQQQNGDLLPGQMQNPDMHRTVPNTDPEYVSARKFMQEKIWEFLVQRRQNHDVPDKRLIDLVKRVEECLFKSSTSKDDYLNLATLESRLHVLIKQPPLDHHNQQFKHANSSPSIGTMIPTPGLQQPGNSSLDNSLVTNISSSTIASSNVNSGSFLPTRNMSSGSMHGGSFSSSDGALANMMASMGVQRLTNQMMTLGFNNSNTPTKDVNSNSNSQPF